jgi:hypothetical protein
VTTYSQPPSKAIQNLAYDALDATLSGNWAAAETAIVRAHAIEPGRGIPHLGLLWADLYAAYATDGQPGPLRLTGRVDYLRPDGRPTGPDDVDAHTAWAARFLTARCQMDRRAYDTVIDEIIDQPGPAIAAHYRALLCAVAATMQAMPPGWALGTGAAANADRRGHAR